MSYITKDMELVKTKIQELFYIVNELEGNFPGRKFTLDGHLVGSIGEVLASFHYNLKLLPNSYETHDAITQDGKYVQIKTTQGKGTVLSSSPDYLIVLWLDRNNGQVLEIYNGPGSPVWDACGKMQKTGTRPISFSKLKDISKGINESDRIISVNPIMKK